MIIETTRREMMATMMLNLGIITGEQKRSIERYVDSRFFEQRKTYDEFYVRTPTAEFNLHLNDLMILAEDFQVSVLSNSIQISDWE